MPHAATAGRAAKSGARRADPKTAVPRGAGSDVLAEYAAKRAFAATPEPAPKVLVERAAPLLFVVQLHSARRLHCDLWCLCGSDTGPDQA